MSERYPSPVIYKITAMMVFIFLGLIIYSNTLKAPFVFDDSQNIQENLNIRLTKFDLESIVGAFRGHNPYRPIANISFALNYYFHQYDVVGYHLINIIIHILTGIFLYLFVKNTLTTPALRNRYSNCSWIAFFAALLWLVHPIQTQSVTYIVQRMNSLAAMFYILSLLLYVKARFAKLQDKQSWLWFLGCILSGLFALGSKQIAATLPFFILLYEWYFFQDLNRRWLKRVFPYIVGIVIFICLLGILYLGTSPFDKILAGYDYRDFNLTERLLTQPRVIINYITLLFAPHPGRLNLDHYVEISRSLTSPATTLPAIGTIFVLIVLAVYLARKNRLFSFCILWFLGNLLIESSVLALELMFEHRLYLPSMFVSLAIVALAQRFIKLNWAKITAFCIIAVLFCSWTYERNKVWADELTLWKDCAIKSPDKARPHNNLGKALRSQGRLDEAITHYHQAIKLKPHYAQAHNNLGVALKLQGNFNEAIISFSRALYINPRYAEAYYNLGTVLATQNKLDEAINYFLQALKIRPHYAEAHNNIANALASQGKLTDAISHYYQALQIKPDFPEAHYNLGQRLQSQGKLDKAINHYYCALQIKPDFAEAHNNMAMVLGIQGNFDEAISHFRQALQINPNYLASLNGMAWMLATHPDPKLRNAKQAVELAEHAAKLTNYQDAAVLGTLATSYAAAGRFDQAVTTAEKALALAITAQNTTLAEEIRKRLELYRQQKP